MDSNIEFRELCLLGATHLAKRAKGKKPDIGILKILATRIRALVDTDQAAYGLMDAQLSLVWDIVRQYSSNSNTFEEFVENTAKLAETFEKNTLSKAENKKLFELCIALHRASISNYNLRDISSYHPDLITFA